MSKNQTAIPSNRKFGLVFTIFFSILGGVLVVGYETHVGFVAVLLAITFGILSFFAEDKLLPINKAWMQFGLLLGRFINPVVLGLIFFILISPVAILTRVFGRDELRISKAIRKTYWRDRNPPGPDSYSFKNQF